MKSISANASGVQLIFRVIIRKEVVLDPFQHYSPNFHNCCWFCGFLGKQIRQTLPRFSSCDLDILKIDWSWLIWFEFAYRLITDNCTCNFIYCLAVVVCSHLARAFRRICSILGARRSPLWPKYILQVYIYCKTRRNHNDSSRSVPRLRVFLTSKSSDFYYCLNCF